MTTILISGSRNATHEMLEIAKSIVFKCWWTRYNIVVGDAIGIDAEVVKCCEKLHLPYSCYGIDSKARNNAHNYTNIRPALHNNGIHYSKKELFSKRDKYMANLADLVVCISRVPYTPGTLAVYNYALLNKKPVIMRTQIKVKEIHDVENVNIYSPDFSDD